MSTAARIIDAIAERLAYADLPEHRLFLYRRPKALAPEDLPAMVIWLRSKSPSPMSTVWFDGTYVIGISWHEEAVDEAVSLEQDRDLSLDLMSRVEAIEAVVRRISTDGLEVEGVWQVLPGDTTYLEPLRESAVSEGYTLDVLVRVTERA